MEVAGDHGSQWSTVSVFHPPICADERELAAWLQQPQAAFDKGNVEVGAIVEGGVAAAVFAQQRGGNQFLSDVGWVADNKVKRLGHRRQKEISVREPLAREILRLGSLKSVRIKKTQDLPACLREGVGVKLDGPDAPFEGWNLDTTHAGGRSGGQQPRDGREQEFPTTKRRLEDGLLIEGGRRGIADEVQNELDHFGAGEDGPALIGPGPMSELSHSVRHRAHVWQAGWVEQQFGLVHGFLQEEAPSSWVGDGSLD